MRAAIVPLAALALLPAACGTEERSFDAETLLAELNEAGAGLELGEALPSTEDDVEVRVVSFAGDEGAADAEGGTAGAVVILGDAGPAQAEFERCESALSFVCFRAANAVLRFTELGNAERERITGAISSLETAEG